MNNTKNCNNHTKWPLFSLLVLFVVLITLGCGSDDAQLQSLGYEDKVLILATTTSTNDTGLLDVLVPAFEQLTGLVVKVISTGTGQALELGRNGDADVLLVHARAAEDEFVAAGSAPYRKDVMYNDYVIIGPANDPAGIKDMPIQAAFQKIADNKIKFVSRGDKSGTHIKEVAVWQSIGIEAPTGAWYMSIGKGMGDTINTANEMLAYTLTDRGTFILMESKIDLELALEGDTILLNPYAVMPVSVDVHPHANFAGAEAFADFITSAAGKKIINDFKIEGKQLFFTE